ncbi:Nucleotidyl transferase AbiEii toxin, Type IV TA system [Kaistella treverensis]|uniref:Nucleotidyl transferase AbiEii toxin, Type IV TA system n=1 Tax=Kaistella treverensis TaxID=631455 RepID=A0A1I3N446_9FLAO|nr:nucleotidyl transferase AbiEii/AbiGii toxin family protein [Kaistella treverensis]SFJ03626.1 Nucleotidyl transferase AbiEii toxin, Type IV TA system [Kaistella treverensis]
MKNKFLNLPEQTRINAINQIAEEKGISPFAVEKDWWVTQTLSIIFEMEEAPYLVFKGGTSLSKSWNLIQRFSEDIDLAIDREFLGFSETPKRKTNLRKKSGIFVSEEFYPKLQKRFIEKGIGKDVRFTLEDAQSDQDPRIINIYYPTLIVAIGYMNPRVQIEVGCRSLKEPYSNCLVSSFIDEEYKNLDFAELAFNVPSVNPEEILEKKGGKVSINGCTKHIRDNQTNISYDKLFGDYLEGATEFIIQDPYIRYAYQFRNFMELCSLIYQKNSEAEKITLKLITWNDKDFMESATESFNEIKDSLAEINIDFEVDFKVSAHDRYITCNNGWRIILGRGLDIWQKSNGRYDIAELLQEKRKCREFDMVVIAE